MGIIFVLKNNRLHGKYFILIIPEGFTDIIKISDDPAV